MYKGTLRLSIPFAWPPSLTASPPYVYLYQHHTYVPYKVETWRARGHRIVLSLLHAELLDKVQNERAGYDVFLPGSWLRKELTAHFDLDSLVFCEGFTVVDAEGQHLGEVAGVQPRPVQPLLLVEGAQDMTAIPVHKHFITEVNMVEGHVKVSWPPR